MPRLFVGNFSFEQSLDPGHQPRQSILRFETELACIWRAVAQEDDAIFCSSPFPEEELDRLAEFGIPRPRFVTEDRLNEVRGFQLIPWGWTPAVRKRGEQLNAICQAPDQEIVWQVNSREWGVNVARELQSELPGETLVRSLPELMPAVQCVHQEFENWIIKPLHGQAGRGQLRGNSPFLSELQFATILHLLSRQGGVTVEPQLNSVLELGGEWEIHQDGKVEFLGMTELLTDPHGRYLGTGVNSVEIPQSARENIQRVQHAAVERLAAAGYFGPVGIDAMIYRQGDQLLERPLQDVNARWTMGRIAWEWGEALQQRLKLEPAGKWLHSEQTPAPTAIALSPEELEGTSVRCRTWWVPQ